MKVDAKAEIIAVVNQREGTGKTSTAVNMAASLATAEKKVLLLEADSQSDVRINVDRDKNLSIYHVLKEEKPLPTAIVSSVLIASLDVLPASSDLWRFDIELLFVKNREQLLLHELAKVKDIYDFIVIDCPSSLGLLTINALVSAQTVIIPVCSSTYCEEEMSQLLQVISTCRENLNPQLTKVVMLLNMMDIRNTTDLQVEREVRQKFAAYVWPKTIPQSNAMTRAGAVGLPVLLHDATSAGAASWLEFVRPFLAPRSVKSA